MERRVQHHHDCTRGSAIGAHFPKDFAVGRKMVEHCHENQAAKEKPIVHKGHNAANAAVAKLQVLQCIAMASRIIKLSFSLLSRAQGSDFGFSLENWSDGRSAMLQCGQGLANEGLL